MVRWRSYFRIAFASPICPAKVRASVIVFPSRVTRVPFSAHSLVRRVVHTDHSDLIVGEQVTFDRLAEREAVEHRAELRLVVHRGDFKVGFLRRLQDPAREVSRGRRHEQPPPAP